MFPQNNDTFRTPKNRYEDATLFEDGNQLDFKTDVSEGARSLDEVREMTRAAELASELAATSADTNAEKVLPTLENVLQMGKLLQDYRKYEQDSNLNIFDEAA